MVQFSTLFFFFSQPVHSSSRGIAGSNAFIFTGCKDFHALLRASFLRSGQCWKRKHVTITTKLYQFSFWPHITCDPYMFLPWNTTTWGKCVQCIFNKSLISHVKYVLHGEAAEGTAAECEVPIFSSHTLFVTKSIKISVIIPQVKEARHTWIWSAQKEKLFVTSSQVIPMWKPKIPTRTALVLYCSSQEIKWRYLGAWS